MHKSEFLDHEREAARYRRLLANATTPALKARLAQQVREHERLAERVEDGNSDSDMVEGPVGDARNGGDG